MPLDPQVRAYLDRVAALNAPPLEEAGPQLARERFEAQSKDFGPRDPVWRVDEHGIPGPGRNLRIRLYQPSAGSALPGLIFFHGGGWVIGSIDSFDAFCRRLANRADCVIASVDYRLAPEHKFPAAVEDCLAATSWILEHATELGVDSHRVGIGGESAGGNLAAVVAIQARDRGGVPVPLRFQLLINPATDLRLAQTASMDAFAEGYGLTRSEIAWFYSRYLNAPDNGLSPLASPLLAPDLGRLPPALIMTAEFDPLRDEGEHYGRRLQEAGVPARVVRQDGLVHGFAILGMMWDRTQQAIAQMAMELRAALSHPAPDAMGRTVNRPSSTLAR